MEQVLQTRKRTRLPDWSADEKARASAMVLAGKTAAEVANAMGRTAGQVQKHCKGAFENVAHRRIQHLERVASGIEKGPWDQRRQYVAEELYAAGYTFTEIGRALSFCREVVAGYIKVPWQPPAVRPGTAGKRRQWTAELQAEAEQLRAQGLGYTQIGNRMGWGEGSIRAKLDPAYAEQQREAGKARMRQKYADPEFMAELATNQRERRRQNGRKGSSTNGLPHRFGEDVLVQRVYGFSLAIVKHCLAEEWSNESIRSRVDQWKDVQESIKKAGAVSVVSLVHRTQTRTPDDVKIYNRARYHLRRLIDPGFVLAMRERSHIRRDRMRRFIVNRRIGGRLLRQRFADFGFCCAYCDADVDLQVEHVVPVSRGGLHDLGNVVPACRKCNYSKHTKPVESWYRSQPFFTEQRWRRIKTVLGVRKGEPVEQLSIPLHVMRGARCSPQEKGTGCNSL